MSHNKTDKNFNRFRFENFFLGEQNPCISTQNILKLCEADIVIFRSGRSRKLNGRRAIENFFCGHILCAENSAVNVEAIDWKRADIKPEHLQYWSLLKARSLLFRPEPLSHNDTKLDMLGNIEKFADFVQECLDGHHKQIAQLGLARFLENPLTVRDVLQVHSLEKSIDKLSSILRKHNELISLLELRLGHHEIIYFPFQRQWISSLVNNDARYMLAVQTNITKKKSFYVRQRSRDFSDDNKATIYSPNFSTFSQKAQPENPMAKIDYRLSAPGSYGSHRDGWAFVMQSLLARIPHDDTAEISIDPFMEKSYVWEYPNVVSAEKSWFGIAHRPQYIPDFYPWKSKMQFYDSPFFAKNYKKLKFIVTVSSEHACQLRKLFDVPIHTILHPTNHDVIKWSPHCLLNPSDQLHLVQIGSWLRRMHSIFRVGSGKYTKAILTKDLSELFASPNFIGEADFSGYSDFGVGNIYNDVKCLGRLSNEEYDLLLANNIVFLDLFSATANNVILECIARHTPIVVRRLAATEEYLGVDYPLFFSELEEVSQIASNDDLIYSAHLYLAKRSQNPEFYIDFFIEKIAKHLETC